MLNPELVVEESDCTAPQLTGDSMTTTYLTHDDVNAAVARELASRLGFSLVVLKLSETGSDTSRLVCDLDHLPPDVKAGMIATARTGVSLPSVGVHSYNLTAAEARMLRSAGVVVSRRLSARLLLLPVPCTVAISA
jgi:hypothetical protein